MSEAEVITPATPAPAAKDSAERGLALIQKHAAATQAAVNAELEGDDIEFVEDGTEKVLGKVDRGNAATDPLVKDRDEKGKFKAKDPSEPAKAEPTVKTKEAPAEPVVSGSVYELQKLVNDGKVEDALKAIGLDPKGLTSKQWEAFHKDAGKERRALDAKRAEAAAQYQNVERIAAGLEQQFGRYRAAQAAYQAGDFDAAFHHAFGEDLNSFQQKAISRMANRDPEVARLRSELQARDARQAQLEQQRQQLAEQQALETERSNYVASLSKELLEVDDPRIPLAANHEDFVQRVFAEQQRRYNPRTDTTISTREAAEAALAQLEKEYRKLQSVFGGQGGAEKPAASASGRQPGGRVPSRPVSPARQATNLRSQEAAEAHREEPLRGRALLLKHARATALAAARERDGTVSE